MTELQRFVETNHLPTRPEVNGHLPALGAGVVALQQWAETAHAAGSLIAQIVDTPFFPQALMPKLTGSSDEAYARQRAGAIANGTGAVLSGVEIGLSPMQALNNVLIIHGRPSLYAETMVALVQAAGHHIWTEESTETRAVVCGRRVNDPAEVPPRRGEMTIERAKKAGYVAKNQKYLTDPVAMLYARAASICCRRTAPEVLKGIPAFEEIQDDRAVPKAGAPAVPAPPVTAAELTGAAPEPEQPAAEPDAPPQEPTEAEVRVREIGTVLRGAGITDPPGMLRIVSGIVNRDVPSPRDLSDDEQCQVLDALALYVEAGEDGRAQLAALAAADQDSGSA